MDVGRRECGKGGVERQRILEEESHGWFELGSMEGKEVEKISMPVGLEERALEEEGRPVNLTELHFASSHGRNLDKSSCHKHQNPCSFSQFSNFYIY